MTHWENIWSFQTARFCVTCDVTPEDLDPAGQFECAEDVEAIRSGALDWFVARVRVTLDGAEIATEYLGGCAYRCAVDFAHKDRDGYFRDMVREACQQARRTLARAPKLRAA
jgi:predicted metal-binding protein